MYAILKPDVESVHPGLYNPLNLPQTISKASESISYIYSANGEKLAQQMKGNSWQYYADGFFYNDKSLNYFIPYSLLTIVKKHMTNNFKFIILGLFIIYTFSYPIKAQINISFNRDCLDKNTAILAQSLIESIGEKKVTELLEKNVHIRILLEVDSLGRVVKFNKVISKNKLPKNLINNLENYLRKSEKRFFICYEILPEYNDSKAYTIISKSMFKVNKKTILNTIGFPGEFMSFYDDSNLTRPRSKFEFLQEQIKKYLSP